MFWRCTASIALVMATRACGSSQPSPSRPVAIVVPSAESDEVAGPDGGATVRAQIPELTRERLPRYMRGNRARALLKVELEGLEKLLSLTKDTSPDYPLLLGRIGMGYVELSMIE